MANILVVDDELGIRDLLFEILNDEGHNVELAENAAEARAARQRARPDLVLLDIWMPDTDGVTLLKEWSTAGLLSMPVIMMSGHATIDTAVDATRIGAFAFLEKPITLQKLLKAVEQGLARESARRAAAGVVPAPVGGHQAAAITTTGDSLLMASLASVPVPDRARNRPRASTLTARCAMARRFREGVLRIPSGDGERLDDPRRREDRPGTHPSLSQAQTTWRRSFRRPQKRCII